MQKLQESFFNQTQKEEMLQRNTGIGIRVAMPGIVQSFNSEEQTVTVKCAVREKVDLNGIQTWTEIPLLLDVPIVLPRAGGYVLTMPVQRGDECLVIFSDNCIDGWWQSGGVQNQVEIRRHDLSDGIAVMGLWSQPNIVPGYSTDGAQLRSVDGGASITISGGSISIKASSVNIDAANVNIGSSTVIDGHNFVGHTHGGVTSGGSNTGGVSG